MVVLVRDNVQGVPNRKLYHVQGGVVLYVGEGVLGLTLMAIWLVDAQIYSQNGWMLAL
jgi:hypothetical protein